MIVRADGCSLQLLSGRVRPGVQGSIQGNWWLFHFPQFSPHNIKKNDFVPQGPE